MIYKDAIQYSDHLIETFYRFEDSYAKEHPELSTSDLRYRFSQYQNTFDQVKYILPDVEQQLKKAVIWSADHGHDLHEPKAIGIGNDALFFQVNNDIGFRFEPYTVRRCDHEMMLPAIHTIHSKRYSLTTEIMPLANTKDVTQNQVNQMCDILREDDRIIFSDPFIGNFGFYKNKLLIIDPGSLKWRPDFAITLSPT